MHAHATYSYPLWPYLWKLAGLGVEILWLRAGGGFTMWGLDTHDSLCRTLANSVPCVVVSVAYRSVFPPCQCPSHLGVMLAGMHSRRMHALHVAFTACLRYNASAF